jgi:hypothetical protein
VATLSVGPCIAASASILTRGNTMMPAAGVERLVRAEALAAAGAALKEKAAARTCHAAP